MVDTLKVPKWVLIIHAVQVVFAIIVLGLSAYGVHFVAYNALIFALVVCICTFGVCAYLLASQLALHSLYNVYVALILHLWMLLFWVVDLGLVANLARLWSGDGYGYYSYYYSIDYSSFIKRDGLSKRSTTTTVEAYYGALAAGAVFAAVEFVSWIATFVILIITWQKHRSAAANNNTTAAHTTQPPPQYAPTQDVPMEKYNQTAVQTQPIPQQQVPQQQQQFAPQQTQQTYQQNQQQQQQSFQHQQSYSHTQQQSGGGAGLFGNPYPQDPVPRQDTVSPVSSAAYGYGAQSTVSELTTPMHTGASSYPAGASELGTPTQGQVYNPNVPELADRK